MEFEECWEKIKDVEGWTDKAELEFLFNAAKNAIADGVILELGSFKGRSTLALALGSKSGPNIKVYAVDIFSAFPMGDGAMHRGKYLLTFQRNMKAFGVDDIVVAVQSTTDEAAATWNKPISILFIDACHDYESVRRDYENFSKFAVPGGIIIFHDTDEFDGPKRFVGEISNNSILRNFRNMTVFITV